MGLPVIRLGSDLTTGHRGFYPVVATSASGNVRVNSKGTVRTGDTYQKHSAPKKPPHVGIAIGSGTVRVNGKQAQRRGDPNSCQDTASNGSKNVRFG